jgi:outer membrane protein TolC
MLKLFILFLFVLSSALGICQAAENTSRQLSLQESIILAVRKNPNVQITQLSHVLQKFALEVQEWEFHPHYQITAMHTTARTYSITPNGNVTSNVSGVQPQVSLLTPIGTRVTLASLNTVTNHYNPGLSLEVIQPLMKGFGRPIVEASLYNALDSEKISRLNVQAELRNTITTVINAYLDVISARNTLEVDQQALEWAKLSLEQTKKFIKAGHKAGVELVTVKASIASMLTRIESDKNIIEQSRYALLTTIGIDPDTNVSFTPIDVQKLIKKYRIPTLDESKKMILENDTQYQVAQITLEGATKRSVLIAKDNTRWKLDLTLNGDVGNSTGGGKNAGINSLINGVNGRNSATLNLTVPIDDVSAKNQYASAVIALRQAEIALRQEKWVIQTNVINGWRNIFSAERVLRYAQDAEPLQRQTYQISLKKYSFGLIDSLELQTAQTELITAQKSVVDNQINYLKALVSLDNLTGMTLKTWDIRVNYEE